VTKGIPTPTKYFLAAGASEGYTPLNAFDASLGKAGVADCNLMQLSSILPPACQLVESFMPDFGSLVPTAYASMYSSLPGEIIAAAVAVAVPKDDRLPGVIMEYSARGSAENVEEIVREMAAEALRIRDREVKEILSTSIEHKVEHIGAVFAGVILGYDED
jgi:arginine decarboxylase